MGEKSNMLAIEESEKSWKGSRILMLKYFEPKYLFLFLFLILSDSYESYGSFSSAHHRRVVASLVLSNPLRVHATPNTLWSAPSPWARVSSSCKHSCQHQYS